MWEKIQPEKNTTQLLPLVVQVILFRDSTFSEIRTLQHVIYTAYL